MCIIVIRNKNAERTTAKRQRKNLGANSMIRCQVHATRRWWQTNMDKLSARPRKKNLDTGHSKSAAI